MQAMVKMRFSAFLKSGGIKGQGPLPFSAENGTLVPEKSEWERVIWFFTNLLCYRLGFRAVAEHKLQRPFAYLKQKGCAGIETERFMAGDFVRRPRGGRDDAEPDEKTARNPSGGRAHRDHRRCGRPHRNLSGGKIIPVYLARRLGAGLPGALSFPAVACPALAGPPKAAEKRLNRAFCLAFRPLLPLFFSFHGRTVRLSKKTPGISCKKEKISLALYPHLWYYN